jgi:hypothetical protein
LRFVLLDWLTVIEPGVRAEAHKQFDPADPVFLDHSPACRSNCCCRDGNGSPDPDLLRSPRLVAAAVPTMNTWWLATLGIGLMLVALRRLRVREANRLN